MASKTVSSAEMVQSWAGLCCRMSSMVPLIIKAPAVLASWYYEAQYLILASRSRTFPGRGRFANSLDNYIRNVRLVANAGSVPNALTMFLGRIAPGRLALL